MQVLSISRTESTGLRIEAVVNQMAHDINFSMVSQSHSLPNFYLRTPVASPSDAQLQAFAGMDPLLMPLVPDIIAVTDPFKAYLLSELGKTEKLMSLLESNLTINLPSSLQIKFAQGTWDIQTPVKHINTRRQEMIAAIYQIQGLLLEDGSNASIMETIIQARLISHRLNEMALYQESQNVHHWVIKFWKHIDSKHASAATKSRIVRLLTDLAFTHYNLRDYDRSYAQSHQVTEEIYSLIAIGRSTELEALMAQNLSLQAISLPPSASAKRDCLAKRAVEMMEQALEIYTSALPPFAYAHLRPCGSFPECVEIPGIARGVPSDHLFSFIRILDDLSKVQASNAEHQNALATKKRVLSLLYYLLNQYPDSERALTQLADVLDSILRLTNHSHLISIDERLAYSNELTSTCHKILRKSESTDDFMRLLIAMTDYRSNLLSVGRTEEARKLYLEITNFSTRALGVYFDPALPSEAQADYYYTLALLHHSVGNRTDAIRAMQDAVTQYSALQALYPDRILWQYLNAVTQLLGLSESPKQVQYALMVCYSVLKNTNEVYAMDDLYRGLLEKVITTLETLKKSVKGINIAVDIAARFESLFTTKENDANFMRLYLDCLCIQATRYSSEGFSNRALEYTTRALRFSPKFSSPSVSLDPKTNFLHTILLRDTGRYHEALNFSRLVLSLYNDPAQTMLFSTKKKEQEQNTIGALYHLVKTQMFTCSNQALVSAKELVFLLRARAVSNGQTDDTYLYQGLPTLAAAQFDCGQVDEALATIREASEIKHKEEDDLDASIESRDSNIFGQYEVPRITSCISFVKADYQYASDIYMGVLEYSRALVSESATAFRQYSIDFCFAGIIFCSIGDHEKGTAILGEFDRLMEELTLSHPTIVTEARLWLDMETRRKGWMMIEKCARSVLKCSHQDGVLRRSWGGLLLATK